MQELMKHETTKVSEWLVSEVAEETDGMSWQAHEWHLLVESLD